MDVFIELGGGWDSPSQLLRGSGTVTAFIPGWVGGGWVGGWAPALGWKGRWDKPRRLLRGSGTVPEFTPGWVGCGWVGGCPPKAGRGVGIDTKAV